MACPVILSDALIVSVCVCWRGAGRLAGLLTEIPQAWPSANCVQWTGRRRLHSSFISRVWQDFQTFFNSESDRQSNGGGFLAAASAILIFALLRNINIGKVFCARYLSLAVQR